LKRCRIAPNISRATSGLKEKVMKRTFRFVAAALALVATQALAQGKVEVLWLGQSAMRITTPTGKVIMVDPWILGNPKTPAAWKNLDAVGKLDLILVTHGHGDHYGDAPALAQKNGVAFWGPAGLNSRSSPSASFPLTFRCVSARAALSSPSGRTA
jgi:glyoxylase-like metal-dependent hydrolase (beta-lactamase superfamily II)